MRYTWIDGLFVEVTKCGKCPFYATECEIGAECRYPHNPANNGKSFDWGVDGIRGDCPLKMTELKPCPCCGSTKIHVVAPDDGCFCWECGLTMPNRPNWRERWNKRAKE